MMALAADSTAFSTMQEPVATIAQLAREASIEITVHDIVHLQESRSLLPASKTPFVSHLPRQQWRETEAACRFIRTCRWLQAISDGRFG
jgi:hypothetical protein